MERSPGIRLQCARIFVIIIIIILKKHSVDSHTCHTSFPVFGHALTGHVLKTVTKDNFARCIFSCELDPQCYSVNFQAQRKLCAFNLGTAEAFQAEFKQRKESVYITMVVREFNPCIIADSCMNGGSCKPYPVTRCICPEGFSGTLCEGLFWVTATFLSVNGKKTDSLTRLKTRRQTFYSIRQRVGRKSDPEPIPCIANVLLDAFKLP